MIPIETKQPVNVKQVIMQMVLPVKVNQKIKFLLKFNLISLINT